MVLGHDGPPSFFQLLLSTNVGNAANPSAHSYDNHARPGFELMTVELRSSHVSRAVAVMMASKGYNIRDLDFGG